jgi:hypothetical protein
MLSLARRWAKFKSSAFGDQFRFRICVAIAMYFTNLIVFVFRPTTARARKGRANGQKWRRHRIGRERSFACERLADRSLLLSFLLLRCSCFSLLVSYPDLCLCLSASSIIFLSLSLSLSLYLSLSLSLSSRIFRIDFFFFFLLSPS